MDPLAEKYINTSPYAFVKNNPISNIEIDGRHFNEKNEKKARKIERKIDKRVGKIENQIARREKKGKEIGDRMERIQELKNSKNDIQSMRVDKKNEYRYSRVGGNSKPVTTPEGEDGNVIVMYTENNMGSKLHETRHGGQVARGETNFSKGKDGSWVAGNLYGVNDEISAYRAQYAYSGSLTYTQYFNINALQGSLILDLQKVVKDYTRNINNINHIDARLINSIADYKGLNIDFTYPKQFVNSKEWENN